MIGWVFAALAGATMSVQGVMNTRMSEKIGLWESNAYVQGTAFVLSLLLMFIMSKGQAVPNLLKMGEVHKGYWLGGVLGIAITVLVMLGIKNLSPTLAIATILLAQLTVAALIDGFGWMGAEKVPFSWRQIAGVALIAGGVVLFKWQAN